MENESPLKSQEIEKNSLLPAKPVIDPSIFNQNLGLGDKKFYTFLILFNLAWLPFVIMTIVTWLVAGIKDGVWIADELGGLFQLVFVPFAIVYIFIAIRTNRELFAYRKDKLAGKNQFVLTRFWATLIVTIILGNWFNLTSLYGILIYQPRQDVQIKKYADLRAQKQAILDSAITYKDCHQFTSIYDIFACADKILKKTGDIRGCLELSAASVNVPDAKKVQDAGFFECNYKGDRLSGSLYSNKDKMETAIKWAETKEADFLIDQKLTKAWEEISVTQKMVYKYPIYASNAAKDIGCVGSHAYVATTSFGVMTFARPCQTEEEFIDKFTNYQNQQNKN